MWAPVALFLINQTPFMDRIYAFEPRIDHLMHGLGGLAIAHMFHQYVSATPSLIWWKKIPLLGQIVLLISFVMLFGVAWEWYEFLHDYFFNTHFQLNNSDTMFDLLFDGIGGCIFSIKILYGEKRTK